MAKFRVWAKMTNYAYLDVEADNEEEAISIAEDRDGGDFTPDPDPYHGDWEIQDDPEIDPVDWDGDSYEDEDDWDDDDFEEEEED